jgi:hypothetical protein
MEFTNLVTIKGKGYQTKKRIRTKMKTHDSKNLFIVYMFSCNNYHLVILLFYSNYHPVIIIMMQQLPSCSSYRHAIAIVMHILSFVDLKEEPQLSATL